MLSRLRCLDYTGNALLIASVTAILLALTYGGTRYSWSSWHVLLPLVLGFVGLGLFIAYESSRWCAEPMTPPHLFQNRTSAAAFYLTFVHSLYSFWVLYFLPIYFQGVQMAGPTRSGVLLPTVIILVPAGLVSGVLLSKFGRYRVIHLAGFALMTLGSGLFILLDNESRLGLYIGLQFFGGVGSGLVLSTLLPATQAVLSEKDTASSTAAWAFIRSLGTVWGVSVPAAIFNSRADNLSWSIDDVSTRDMLGNGQAYSHASADWLSGLSNTTQSQVTNVFSESLRTVLIVLTAIAGVSVFIVFVEKEIKMREELDTEYGISVPEKTATTAIEPRDEKEESKAD